MEEKRPRGLLTLGDLSDARAPSVWNINRAHRRCTAAGTVGVPSRSRITRPRPWPLGRSRSTPRDHALRLERQTRGRVSIASSGGARSAGVVIEVRYARRRSRLGATGEARWASPDSPEALSIGY